MKGAGNRSWKGPPKTGPESPGESRWLRGASALAVLETALNAIDAPAFVVDLGGAVLHANTNAQALLDRDWSGVSRSLVDAVAGASATAVGLWDLTPLTGNEQERGFLAIMRPPRHAVVVQDLIRAAGVRWHLTARQTEVLRWVAQGLTNLSIADTLGISQGTVEFHLKVIFDKAGVDNRATLIAKVLEP